MYRIFSVPVFWDSLKRIFASHNFIQILPANFVFFKIILEKKTDISRNEKNECYKKSMK